MEIVEQFLHAVLSVLPQSPFASFIDALSSIPYLGYLNYFIPIGSFIAIGQSWLVAVGLFYLYSIIMRWIRMIQ